MLDRLRNAAASSFVRAVGVLVGGTALAQLILGLTLPIATRLYSPADFNVLAVFAGIVGILSVAISLRYDIAVALPEDPRDGAALVVLGSGIAALLSLVIAVPMIAAPGFIATSIGQPRLAPYLLLLPAATLLAGCYSCLQFWFVRGKAFVPLARNRIAQALASSATQIGLGLLHVVPAGLLLGQTVNSGAAALRLGYMFVRQAPIAGVDIARLRHVAGRYKRFPAFSTAEALANSAAIYLPIILLGAWAKGPEAGYLMLGMYALQVPISLIGTAVSQVYMSRGPEESRAGRMGVFTAEILTGLMQTGVGPLICLAIAAPPLFGIVFGHDWVRAGELVSWMAPWFIFQFLASPLSLSLHISNRLGAALLLQLFGLVLRTGAVYLATLIPGHPLSEAYALSGLLFYLCYLVIILHATGTPMRPLLAGASKSLPIWIGWAALGVVMDLVLAWL